jgi:DNA (cytosine-5)-methyltransferase 1
MLDFVNKSINPPPPYKFTVLTTFGGIGGSSLGYKWAGGKILACVEWDVNAVETYRLNHIGTPVLHRDIASITAEELREYIPGGELDIFDGSPPCQGFSISGKRKFNDPRNSLFKEFVRLLRELQPKVLVMENVSGMVKGDMKHIFVQILKELKSCGYTVHCQLLNMSYFGVPQARERIIFIGVRNDLGIAPSFPLAQTYPITLREALRDVVNTKEDIEISKYKYGSFYHNLLQRLQPGQSGDDYSDKGNNFSLSRLRWDRPARTVLKEGGSIASSCCHPDEHRRLTIPELKRVSSFPDAFQFVGSFADQWARMGNTVPPRFMQSIAEHIYENILSKTL